MKIIYKGFGSKNESLAVATFAKGNYKDALYLWENILEKNPANVYALKGVVFCLLMNDNYKEALLCLEEGIPYARKDFELHNLLALTHLKEGNVNTAIDILLNGLEHCPNKLLQNTLENIRTLENPDLAKNISILPFIQLTFPATKIKQNTIKKKISEQYLPFFITILSIFLVYKGYPTLKKIALYINFKDRNFHPSVIKSEIRNLDKIINARENFSILLSEEQIIKKFEELKKAISDRHYNKSHILANQLLGSNASELVKEKVYILESLIADPNIDSIDYIPSYAEIAVSPSIYKDILVHWQGIVVNAYHNKRKKTTFDLLINFSGKGKVEGIANVELEGFHDIQNGKRAVITGAIDGLTDDYRVIVNGEKVHFLNTNYEQKSHVKSILQKNREKNLGS